MKTDIFYDWTPREMAALRRGAALLRSVQKHAPIPPTPQEIELEGWRGGKVTGQRITPVASIQGQEGSATANQINHANQR